MRNGRLIGGIDLLLLVACFGGAQAQVPTLRLATWNLEHLAADTGAGCRPRSDADYAHLRPIPFKLAVGHLEKTTNHANFRESIREDPRDS